jgi:Ser/Thr protein kinase RdoA (MazF antagonist)
VEILARFHRTGRKLSTPPRREAAFLLYERIHTRLVRFYEVLKRAHHVKEGWGTLLSKYGYEFYQDGLDAWERLNRLPLKEFCQAERMNRHLTHRDLASHNWLVTPDGGVWLIDFETVEYDTQLGDVWQMASRVLTQNDWADDWYDLILQTYESVCPLSSLEKKIVYTLFLFPNEFYREAIGVAERKQSFHPKHSMDYLYKIVENRNKWKKQLKQITYW